MQIARIDGPDGPTYAVLDADVARRFDAPPWERWAPTEDTVPRDRVRLLAPVTPSKIVGIGRNYHDHIEEMGYAVPERPSIFLKPPSAMIGPDDDLVLPPVSVSNEVHHEAELAVVIGRTMRHVSPEDALEHVYGWTGANDVSARDLQRQDGNPLRGKAFDTFCPLGPWIETDLDLAGGIGVRCWVDGELRQDGSTDRLVFDVPTLLSTLSGIMTLVPGDVVLTGSPGGSRDLQPGNRVRVEIEGIGSLENPVVRDA